MDHSLLPNRNGATLPAKYEAAKAALAECNRLDECKDWGDKAAALASYAKQADDKEMERTAMRIRARACRRCGVLLQEFEKANGANQNIKGGGAPKVRTRKDAAQEAGLSPDQAKNAVRVANVPKEDFEKQVESEEPPTVSNLAEQGTKKRQEDRPIYERQGMTKKAFQAGMHFRGHLSNMAGYTLEFDPQDVADGSLPDERKLILRSVETIERYLKQLKAKLR